MKTKISGESHDKLNALNGEKIIVGARGARGHTAHFVKPLQPLRGLSSISLDLCSCAVNAQG